MKETTKARIEISLVFFLLLYILPQKYSETDFEFWMDWALVIHDHGPLAMYKNGILYHPVFPYMIYLYDLIMQTRENIIANINYLKVFPMIFDFLPVVVLCCFRQRFVQEKIPYMFLILNMAYLFNSICWGQADSMFSSMCFLALLVGLYYPAIAIMIFVTSFLTKFQSIMFLPALLLVVAYSTRTWKSLMQSILLGAATATVILLPFILTGQVGLVLNITTNTVDFMSHVSVQAYNIWFLLIWGIPFDVMDYETFIVLSYKQTGLLMFFIASGITMVPLVGRLLAMKLNKMPPDRDLKQLLLITVGLTCFYFFYFNTQMHERYIHPTLLLFFFYAVYSKNYLPYILLSIPYLLSMEKTLPNFLPIEHPRIIFSARVIALLYTGTLIYTMTVFFRQYKVKEEWKCLWNLLLRRPVALK